MGSYPLILQTALDTTDVRGLAEFYRVLLGLRYRPGDDRPEGGAADDADWLVLVDDDGLRRLAFQQVDELAPSTWPRPEVPQQLHLDLTVEDVEALEEHRDRALALGARILLDRSADEEEPLYVFADPSGHPFCIFVG